MYRVAFKIGENTAVTQKHLYDASIKIWTSEHDPGERFGLAVSKIWSSIMRKWENHSITTYYIIFSGIFKIWSSRRNTKKIGRYSTAPTAATAS